MFSKGYFKATTELLSTRFVSNAFVVTIGVKEGTRVRIGEIKIDGAKVFTKDEILEMWGQREGEIADGKQLQDFLYDKLKRIYGDKGYILYNAEFDPQFIKPLADGLDGIVNLLVTIDEGKRIKFTGIHFRGVSEEENEKLIESFPLKKGDFLSKSEFEKGIEVINQTEKFMPIDINRDVDIKTTEKFSGIDISRLNDVKLNEEPEDAFWVVSLRERR